MKALSYIISLCLLWSTGAMAFAPGFLQVAGGGGAAQSEYIVDLASFAGSNGDAITTADSSWSLHSSYSGTTTIYSSRVYGTNTASIFYRSETPNVTQTIEAVYKVNSTALNGLKLAGRINTGAMTLLECRAQGARYISLYKVIGGSSTRIGSEIDAGAPSVGADIPVKFEISGISPNITATITWNGSQVITTSSINESGLDSAGKVGLGFYSGGGAWGDAVGQHISSFKFK